jgi:hypothetical protein
MTSNVCFPFARSVYVIWPLSQLSAAPPSRTHWKVTEVFDSNANVAVFEAMVSPSAGPAVMATIELPAAPAEDGRSTAMPAHASARRHVHVHRRPNTSASVGEASGQRLVQIGRSGETAGNGIRTD